MLVLASSLTQTTRDTIHNEEIDTPTINLVYGNHNRTYQDLEIIKPLAYSMFPVYLVNSRITKKQYAMKIFEHDFGSPHLYFKNGNRFACMRHPHVLRHLYFEDQMQVKLDHRRVNISYTITEYASNGNFTSFFEHHREQIDEKLTRTYFKQLIDGLEYLHSHGIAHTDLKPENLLLDQDFNLKIADFDMAHFTNDAIIISNGTQNYRAPEVKSGKCNDPKAADIYSAGIILFVLLAKGMLPFLEEIEMEEKMNLACLLHKISEKSWICPEQIQPHNPASFDQSFQELFTAMTHSNPAERASIKDIKASKWYKGSCYASKELKEKMGNLVSGRNQSVC